MVNVGWTFLNMHCLGWCHIMTPDCFQELESVGDLCWDFCGDLVGTSIPWVLAPPSNSDKRRFIGISLLKM